MLNQRELCTLLDATPGFNIKVCNKEYDRTCHIMFDLMKTNEKYCKKACQVREYKTSDYYDDENEKNSTGFTFQFATPASTTDTRSKKPIKIIKPNIC